METFAAVSTLLSTYAWGYDSQDPALVASTFLPDGAFTLHLPTGESMSYRGREAIAAFMDESLQSQDGVRRHFTVNLRVLDEDGAGVRVGSYLLLGAIDSSGLRIVQSGRYDDLIDFADGTARFRSRQLTMDGEF